MPWWSLGPPGMTTGWMRCCFWHRSHMPWGIRASGDFVMGADGRIARANGRPGLVYLGAQIIRTEGLADFPERVFSLNRLWDRMIADGRAYGTLHDGGWCDVGRPEGIATAEAMLAQSRDA